MEGITLYLKPFIKKDLPELIGLIVVYKAYWGVGGSLGQKAPICVPPFSQLFPRLAFASLVILSSVWEVNIESRQTTKVFERAQRRTTNPFQKKKFCTTWYGLTVSARVSLFYVKWLNHHTGTTLHRKFPVSF